MNPSREFAHYLPRYFAEQQPAETQNLLKLCQCSYEGDHIAIRCPSRELAFVFREVSPTYLQPVLGLRIKLLIEGTQLSYLVPGGLV